MASVLGASSMPGGPAKERMSFLSNSSKTVPRPREFDLRNGFKSWDSALGIPDQDDVLFGTDVLMWHTQA